MKASINLLPNEYAVTEKQQKKFSTVQTFSIVAILIVFLIASIIVALRIFQSKDIENANTNVKNLQNQIASSKTKEAALFVLKNRLSSISKIFNSSSSELANFNYTEDNLPPGVVLSSISADQTGTLGLAMQLSNSVLLGNTVDVLTNPASFEKFKQINIESLSRGQDGIYRMNLKAVPKQNK